MSLKKNENYQNLIIKIKFFQKKKNFVKQT